jgi:predicted amidohydrolase
MKICVAQTKPMKGNIQGNIKSHKKLINLAISHGANMVIFPELSITGYEPQLAKNLATDQADSRFDDLQKIADSQQITIGIGIPTKHEEGIMISMAIFQPDRPRQVYSKQYLHEDEYPYFVNGEQPVFLTESGQKISLAICYELSVPEHSAHAYSNGAGVYIASVAKTVNGLEKAFKNLSDIAKQYSMTVLMSNCIGPCDDFESAGKSSIWNNQGMLVGQLNDTQEGILLIDTYTQEISQEMI